MSGTLFEDIDLSDARFVDVALQRANFQNVNMTGVSIDDANITGLTIFGYDVQALIRDHQAGAVSAAASDDGSKSAADITTPNGREFARAFLPSKDFAASKAFYEAIGFTKLLDSDVAIFGVGTTAIILTRQFQKDWAENCMMQLMVDDLDAWWRHIETLDLPNSHGVPMPSAGRPAMGLARCISRRPLRRPLAHRRAPRRFALRLVAIFAWKQRPSSVKQALSPFQGPPMPAVVELQQDSARDCGPPSC